MILADTGIWVDHFRVPDERLSGLAGSRRILVHPMIIGEFAMGNFPLRDSILAEFAILPAVAEASHREVIDLVGRSALFGTGLSFIDAHILAAVILTSNATLWTRDRRLKAAARQFGVDASID